MFATALILSILLIPVLAFLGTAKVIRHPMMVQRAQHLGFSARGFQIVGGFELAGVAGLVIGLFWVPPLGIAASAGLVLLLIGGAIAHARVRDRFPAIAPAVVCAALSATTLVLLAAG